MLRARLLGRTWRGPNVHLVVSTTHDNTAKMRQLAPIQARRPFIHPACLYKFPEAAVDESQMLSVRATSL